MRKGQRLRCANSLHLLNELYTAHWVRMPATNRLPRSESTHYQSSPEDSEYKMRQDAIRSRSYWAARGLFSYLLSFQRSTRCSQKNIFPHDTFVSAFLLCDNRYFCQSLNFCGGLPMTLALAEQSFNHKLHLHSPEAMTVSKKNLIAFIFKQQRQSLKKP